MTEELQTINQLLLAGIKKAMQTSYGRRAPKREAIPLLEDARVRLKQYCEQYPESAEAWRLLSLAEECLMKYRDAVLSLEAAIRLASGKNRKDLKRLAMLKENNSTWEKFPLSPQQVQQLRGYLKSMNCDYEPKGRTLENTRKWLELNKIGRTDEVLEALGERGGYTDFQVFHNL